jgi:hypothetical protein
MWSESKRLSNYCTKRVPFPRNPLSLNSRLLPLRQSMPTPDTYLASRRHIACGALGGPCSNCRAGDFLNRRKPRVGGGLINRLRRVLLHENRNPPPPQQASELRNVLVLAEVVEDVDHQVRAVGTPIHRNLAQ